MKLLCFSDLHISNRNSKFKKTGSVSDLLLRQELYVKWIRDYAVGHDVDAVLFLGDWTDYPTLDPVTLTYSNRMIGFLDQIGKPVILIEGNHCITDRGNRFTVIGAADELEYENLSFIFQEELVELDIAGTTVSFHCFPYSSDYKGLEGRIARCNSEDTGNALDIFLFHFPTTNAVLDNGLQSKKGVNLSQEITDKFDLCIGGDFHYHQQLINNDKAYYVGAPFSLRFGEHCDRGSVVFDIDVKSKSVELEFISNPHQLPIRKATFDEVINMSDEELANGVYRVLDATDEEYAKLALIKERAYKLDVSRPKYKKQMSENIHVMDAKSGSRDVAILQSRLDTLTLDESDKARVTKLFESIKVEVDE